MSRAPSHLRHILFIIYSIFNNTKTLWKFHKRQGRKEVKTGTSSRQNEELQSQSKQAKGTDDLQNENCERKAEAMGGKRKKLCDEPSRERGAGQGPKNNWNVNIKYTSTRFFLAFSFSLSVCRCRARNPHPSPGSGLSGSQLPAASLCALADGNDEIDRLMERTFASCVCVCWSPRETDWCRDLRGNILWVLWFHSPPQIANQPCSGYAVLVAHWELCGD